jgi:alkaline phosphatase D
MKNDELLRRAFLARSGQYLALTFAVPYITAGQANVATNPFTLGVASGDPMPDGVVLWTRLAPDPLTGGGMPSKPVEVEWQVARDEQMSQIAKKGKATASPDLAHSVHVEVRGLEPARWYWYQFRTGSHVSGVGRTRTAPEPRKQLSKLAFAFASCQHYETGYFTAYRHMVQEELDLIRAVSVDCDLGRPRTRKQLRQRQV